MTKDSDLKLLAIVEKWKLNTDGARVSVKLGDLREAAAAISRLVQDVSRCHARLEIDHYFKIGDNDDSDLERVDIPMEERGSFPDGIDARDATIAVLEEDISAAREVYLTLQQAETKLVAKLEEMRSALACCIDPLDSEEIGTQDWWREAHNAVVVAKRALGEQP